MLFVESKPILVVLNAQEEEIKTITEWEKNNILYEKEIGFLFFRYLKRISLKKYMALN